MDASFKKHKSKYQRNAIIKSAVCGVSLGLLVVGICLLSLKLSAVSLNVGYYILIGVGSAGVCGGLMFLIFNPSDKRVAKRLDNDYKLSERAQTALAYQAKEGTLIELQREDTATKLSSLPKLKFKFSKIWQYCAIAVIAVAMALTGILVPSKEAQATIPVGSADYPWRISQLEIFKVRELIANVRASHLNEDTKTSVADVLEELLVDLETASTVGKKDEFVYTAVSEIDGIITPLNNYQSYAAAFETMGQKYLSHAITRGVIIYRSQQLTSSTYMDLFYSRQFELVGEAISGPVEALRKEFSNDEELLEQLGGNAVLIASAANYAANGDTSDEIYVAMDWLVEQLTDLESQLLELEESDKPNSIAEEGEPEEESQWQIKLDSIFQSFSDRLAAALEVQAYNFAMNKFVGNSLKLIFDLPIDEDDKPLGDYDPDDPVAKDPGIVPPHGDIEDDPFNDLPGVAAKDHIYEPPGSSTGLGGQYVTLNDVYYYYLSILQEMLREGNLTEEQQRMVMAYFDMLTGGLKSDNN